MQGNKKIMKQYFLLLLLICYKPYDGHTQSATNAGDKRSRFVASLLAKMTLQEKIGQLCQYVGGDYLTGPEAASLNDSLIKNGMAGSVLNVTGIANLRQLQENAVNNSRLKIPLLFGYDVIHGYKTIFPVPLAESCSWDLEAMTASARIAAMEASAAGLHWTFAPMLDIARDPRWGRVVEGAGEDSYLGSRIAEARIKGFQWHPGETDAVLACAKHFAAYGLPQAGKDYGPVDMSDRTLHDIYLPPFKAAAVAGVATFMTAFNEINGIPSTANKYLLKDLLVNRWGFKGFVVSDWKAVIQQIAQGTAANEKEAAAQAFNAGTNMDMTDGLYNKYMALLVKEKKVNIEDINDGVRRILYAKYDLGLFTDPYRFFSETREKETVGKPAFITKAREIARKSIVLLENKNEVLPLSASYKSIAVVGPLAHNKSDILGSWIAQGDSSQSISLLEGIRTRFGSSANIDYTAGCSITGNDTTGFAAAVTLASASDVVLLAIGEEALMTGESNSRSTLRLPGVQERLAMALIATGKPVVVLLMNGRPLTIGNIASKAAAVVETWFLGSQTGNAIADVLSGDYNPSGKLTITFPATDGQIPVYYNHKQSGRPGDMPFSSTNRYVDIPSAPLYPFGYGLSYTSFGYSGLRTANTPFTLKEPQTIYVTVRNTGKYDGEEIVQLYVRDIIASVTRPVKELKGFTKIFLKAGESKEVRFQLKATDLGFTGINNTYITEPGAFEVMIGGSSAQTQSIQINLHQ